MRWGDSYAIEDAMNSMETEDRAPAKTNAQRQAELKAKRQAAGLVPVTNLWAHPDDVQAIRDEAAKLARRRERAARKAAP